MHKSFIDKINSLEEEGKAFATAFIVRRRKPSSGKPGDKAIITEDGKIFGWIGGGCTRGIVLKEALLSMQDRKPRLVSIAKDQKVAPMGNTKTYSMTCQSDGEVEVYIEPVLPKPSVFIFGSSHIALAVAKIAKSMDYRVACYVSNLANQNFEDVDEVRNITDFEGVKINSASYFIVSTQGEGDLEALEKALSVNPSYLGFVASRKKANGIFRDLRAKGITFDQLKSIKTPAGIDIHAKTPDEVAISILAEIIQHFRVSTTPAEEETLATEKIVIPNEDYYINPVCNIPVQKSTAKYVLEYEDEKVYFCCDGCKVSFEKEPSKYMVKQ